MRHSLLVVIIGIIFLFGLAPAHSAEGAGKTGYIDSIRAFNQYQKTINYEKELEKKTSKKEAERKKKVFEIKRLREELELLSEKGRGKKQAQIEKKMKNLQDFDLATRTDLKKERDGVVREILEEIDKVVQEYGKSEGYSLILSNRALLYADGKFNLTDKIIKILNKKYKKGKR